MNTLLELAKQALRISLSQTAFDYELLDLIEAAKADLLISGVTKKDYEEDPLLKRAIMIYCKANFGYDNPEAERLQQSYNNLKTHLSLAGDYNAV